MTTCDKNKATTIVRDEAWYKANIEGVANWRQIDAFDLEIRSCIQMRRTYRLFGRNRFFCHRILDERAEQNKDFKFRFAHRVEEGWNGSYVGDCGYAVSDYVYGEVVIIPST